MEEEGEAEDKEIAKSPLKDIRENSESNKTPAAKAHFNDFLEILCKEMGVPVITIDDLPCLGLGDHGDCQAW